MTNVSMAGTGLLVMLIEVLLKILGVEVPEGGVAENINNVVMVVGFVLLIVGQVRRKDLKFGIFRK